MAPGNGTNDLPPYRHTTRNAKSPAPPPPQPAFGWAPGDGEAPPVDGGGVGVGVDTGLDTGGGPAGGLGRTADGRGAGPCGAEGGRAPPEEADWSAERPADGAACTGAAPGETEASPGAPGAARRIRAASSSGSTLALPAPAEGAVEPCGCGRPGSENRRQPAVPASRNTSGSAVAALRARAESRVTAYPTHSPSRRTREQGGCARRRPVRVGDSGSRPRGDRAAVGPAVPEPRRQPPTVPTC